MEGVEPEKSPAERDDPLLWGTPWRLVRRLGIAELAEVVLAEQRDTGARAHVKVLRLDVLEQEDSVGARERIGERVRLEGDALRRLEHASVPRLLDLGYTPDGRPFFATEILEDATTLAEWLAGGPLEVADVLKVGKAVASALRAAHALGLIHRDIKPRTFSARGSASCSRTSGSPRSSTQRRASCARFKTRPRRTRRSGGQGGNLNTAGNAGAAGLAVKRHVF